MLTDWPQCLLASSKLSLEYHLVMWRAEVGDCFASSVVPRTVYCVIHLFLLQLVVLGDTSSGERFVCLLRGPLSKRGNPFFFVLLVWVSKR